MTKPIYLIFLLTLLFSSFHQAEALSIQYGSIIDSNSSKALIQYYGIDKKQNFICSITTLKCSLTKKAALPVTSKVEKKFTVPPELKGTNRGRFTFSSDGLFLAYYVSGNELNPNRSYILRNMNTGKEYTLSQSLSYWDLVDDEQKVFTFSPDNKKLIYMDDSSGYMSLYIVDIPSLDTTLTSVRLPTSTLQVSDFLFTTNQVLYYVGNTKENPHTWSLYRYVFQTKKTTIIAKNVSYVNSIKNVGEKVIFNQLQKEGYGPALYNTVTKKVQHFTIPQISSTPSLVNEQVVESHDLHAVLMTPTKKGTKSTSYPLVIWLHGGPYRQTSLKYHPYHSYGIYDSLLELLRKNNVIVLKLDYPGSYGYGRNYAESIKGSIGTNDVASVMNAIAYAKQKYNIENVYLMGNSYGGYLSFKTLVEHPSSITGVMSINGVTDWESMLTDMQISIFNTQFNGLPSPSTQSLYDQASIINKISAIDTQKISIIAGEADRTIPFSQATNLYALLKNAHKNVTLTSYKGEDHVYRHRTTLVSLCNEMFTLVNKKVDPSCNK